MLLYNCKEVRIKKLNITSGASRGKNIIKFNFLSNKFLKKLTFKFNWVAGITNTGKRVTLSKGRKETKGKSIFCSYNSSDLSLHFHYGNNFTKLTNKLYSLYFSSSGKFFYHRNKIASSLFGIYINKSTNVFFKTKYQLPSYLLTKQLFLTLRTTLLNSSFTSSVRNLQLKPTSVIKFARAESSSALILKKHNAVSSTVIKLPSGVKKIFSLFSTCSTFYKKETINKKIFFNSFPKPSIIKGVAPRSRGVAKNPVDHPHGGRTKAIRYPRTP
jgi:hypothetical protein